MTYLLQTIFFSNINKPHNFNKPYDFTTNVILANNIIFDVRFFSFFSTNIKLFIKLFSLLKMLFFN